MQKFWRNLTYLVLVSLIGVCLYAMREQFGHSKLCQREIDRLRNEIASSIELAPAQVVVRPLWANWDARYWLIALPPQRTVKVSLLRQEQGDSQAKFIREFELLSGRVAEVVALNVGVMVDGPAALETITIESSQQAKLEHKLAEHEKLITHLHDLPTVRVLGSMNLFAVNIPQPPGYSQTKLDAQFVLEDSLLLTMVKGLDARSRAVAYGIVLSIQP